MQRLTFAAVLAALALLVAPPAGAALPTTSSPQLRLERTIRTTPFTGTSTSTHDGEGTAYVARDTSLWLVGDNNGSMFEIDPYTGALERTITRSSFDSAPRFGGGGPQAGRDRTGDFESLAYDDVQDVLYAFSGSCCTSSALPTVFRLTRDPVTRRLVVESYQPLSSTSDFTAAAWNPRDGKVYVGKGRSIRSYDYVSNTTGSSFGVSGLLGITGLDFTPTGSDLMAVTNAAHLFRVNWSTKAIVSGWDLNLWSFGVRDSRAVEVIPERADPSVDQLYVFDGYDGRPSADPLRYAVFVFDVSGPGGGGGGSGGNLVGNPSFESGTTGWAAGGLATLVRFPGGHDGIYSVRLSNATTASGTCMLNDSPNWVSSTTAGTYTATMWVRADAAGATLKLRLREYDGATLVGTPAVSSVALTASWQKVTVTAAASAGHTLDLTSYVANAPPGNCFYADDVSITLG